LALGGCIRADVIFHVVAARGKEVQEGYIRGVEDCVIGGLRVGVLAAFFAGIKANAHIVKVYVPR
jgi:hypothetical protein